MDSNVENILRNMVDGTTEYDPPHSRVEKLLIELKEALDAGGGGGTVDDVARNRINTHVDNSNVHVSTTEKSLWNNKAELSDIPTSLPANGGNADTVDGYHESDFTRVVSFGSTSTDLNTTYGEAGRTMIYKCTKWTNYPSGLANGQGTLIVINWQNNNSGIYCRQIFTSAGGGTKIFQRTISGTPSNLTVNSWTNVADGGNADALDGKHANQMVQWLGKITSVDIANDPNYAVAYECNLAPTAAVEIGLDSAWYHLKYFRHEDGGTVGWGIQIAIPLTNTTILPKYRCAGNNETSWSTWHNFADGGNADTVDGLHANEIASNPNLLINPDFAVNQREITSASVGTSSVYIADMWYSQRAIISRPENGGISIAWDGTNKDNGWIQQKIETAALFGKTVTISVDIDGERKSVTITVPALVNKTDGGWVDSDKQVMLAVSNLGGTLMSVVIFSYTTTPIAVSNVKLELGANATRYYPPDSAAELAKCQRYYQIRSTGDIAAVDMRPSMATIKDIKQRSDGNYEYIAEL